MLPAGAPSAFTMPDGHQVELTIIICTDTIATHIIIITSLTNQKLSYFWTGLCDDLPAGGWVGHGQPDKHHPGYVVR